MQFMVHRTRLTAYHRIVNSYQPHVSVAFLAQELQLRKDDERRRFFAEVRPVVEGELLMTKASKAVYAAILAKEREDDAAAGSDGAESG
jgi:hypothetical protein